MSGTAVQLTETDLAILWDPGAMPLSPDQANLITPLRYWLGKGAKVPLADFLSGKPVERLSKHDAKVLTGYIFARFRPLKRGVAALQLLGKVLDHGNARGIFSICPPPAPFLQKRQPSPFAKPRWRRRVVAPGLRTLLETSIISPRAIPREKYSVDKVAQVALGQLLVSAIVHGGLLHASLLETLVRRMLEPDGCLDCLGNRLFVELSLGWRGQADAEFRRWFPDPLSSILIMQISPVTVRLALKNSPADPAVSLRADIWRAIRAFLRHAGETTAAQPASLAVLLDAVRLDLESRLPVVLADYAARSLVSHSLKPSVLRRLHGIAVETRLDEAPSGKPGERASDPPEIRSDESDVADAEPRWLSQLRAAMRGDDRKSIVSRIDALVQAPADGFAHDAIGELFASFALQLFGADGKEKATRGIRTARACVISVSKRLGGLIGAGRASDIDSEEWIGYFEEAISDAESPGVRRKLVAILREFHAYLVSDRGVEPIDVKEVFGTAGGLVPVDANIISEEEFLRIRERFASGMADDIHPELENIAWLLLTVAYRCGLRRMEALKLLLADVLLAPPAELLVRPNWARNLKTKSSTRKIPLYALLDPDELKRMRLWFDARLNDERAKPFSRFLFAASEMNRQFIAEDGMFKLLHRVMREETGDPTLRFHHLRHSFASHLCIKLLAGLPANPSRHIPPLPAFAGDPSAGIALRRRLYGNDHMTRRDIWTVAALLGHSGPDVSLEHYVHVLDIALAEKLATTGIAPALAAVISASGKSAASAYQSKSSDDLHAWVAELWRKGVASKSPDRGGKRGVKVAPGSGLPSDVDQLTATSATESLMRIWRLLLLHETRNEGIEELSARRRIVPQDLARYVANATWLSKLTMSEKGSTFRHRFRDHEAASGRHEARQRTACPLKPREARDQKIVELLAPRFRQAFIDDRPLAIRVLNDFAENSRPDFAGMIFCDPEQPERAQDFVRWLELLGFKKKDLRFISFDVCSTRSKASAQWKRALGLRSSDVIDKRVPPNGRRDWACPWLGIEPVFPDESGSRTGSAAFRFVMVMAIIATHIPDIR